MGAEELVESYIDMWNETDDAKRRGIIERIWAPDARSVDPAADVTGWDGLDSMVKAVQETYPGHLFSHMSDIDQHHDRLRFSWAMNKPNGAVNIAGIDSVLLDCDGRIKDLTGYFDVVPS